MKYINCSWLAPVFLAISIAAVSVNGYSEESGKSPRIDLVLWRGETDAEAGFKDYWKNTDLTPIFSIKNCNADKKKLEDIIEEVRTGDADLVYTFGTTVTKAVLDAKIERNHDGVDERVPLVFNIVTDPEILNQERGDDANKRIYTGVSHIPSIQSQLDVINSFGTFQTLGVIYNPAEENSLSIVKSLQEHGVEYGYSVIEAPVSLNGEGTPLVDSVRATVEKLAVAKPGIVYLPSDSFVIKNAEIIIALINKHGIPTFSVTEEPVVKHHALIGLVGSYYNAGNFAAYKAAQIVRGEKRPDEIPIESLKRFRIIINMSTAKMIGVFPTIGMLRVADIVGDDDASPTPQGLDRNQ